ncbi:MAG: hypothetical protein ACREDO_05990 [Methyloceanibacter sp.]
MEAIGDSIARFFADMAPLFVFAILIVVGSTADKVNKMARELKELREQAARPPLDL